MAIALSCPYCNTAFHLNTLPADRRAVCPRCGDAFPVRAEAVPDSEAEGLAESPASPVPLASAPMVPPRRRRVPRFAWVLMGLGLVGLGFALKPLFRGEPVSDPAPLVQPGTLTPPAGLAGLRYLPPESNLVFALQPASLLDYAKRTNQDATTLLTELGVPASVFETLNRLGLPLEQLDHLAGGLVVGDAVAELRLTLALVLRQPLADEDAVVRSLNGRRTTIGERTVHQAQVGPLSGVLVWKASPTVWILTTRDTDLPPAAGGPGLKSATLTESLRTRLGPNTAAWIAADDANWAEKPGVRVLAAVRQSPDLLSVLAKGRAAVLGVSFDDTPRVRLFLHAADEPTAAAIRGYFQRKAFGTRGGVGAWATLDMPFEPQTIGPRLQTMFTDAVDATR